LPVAADFAAFWRDFEWMGVQRQLKVLGIFARLEARDGKAGYVADMPRVRRYLRRACARYPELDRLTVLLDAAPVNPYSQKLRAWDRSFLLSALSTVMSRINCRSVRLIAFNMDQQKEFFRKEKFDQPGFSELAHAMRNLELGMVSFQVLQEKHGHAGLLSRLANLEMTDSAPSDAVIWLGPHTRFLDKPPQELLPARGGKGPQFFYLEYMPVWLMGREFPDVLEYVTKALNGTNFKIHSPAELAQAVQKIALQVKHDGKQPGVSGQ